MRIAAVRLSWFRGAGAAIELDASGRSVAVYGANGSGKSSFVDALEYILARGRIRHLAHEYSGKNQERAILNTHRPAGSGGEIAISFVDQSVAVASIAPSGAHSLSGQRADELSGWDARRLLLRQDEVSAFVHSTKGEKYSVLLPLLGLGHLENAAENLRQLSAAVVRLSGIKEAQTGFRSARTEFEGVYGKVVPTDALSAMTVLCETFVSGAHEHSSTFCPTPIEAAINARLQDVTALQRQQIAVEELAHSDLKKAVAEARAAAAVLASAAGKATHTHLVVLKATDAFLATVSDESVNECPACGSRISGSEIRSHLKLEMTRLEDALSKAGSYDQALRAIRSKTERVVSLCKGSDVTQWAVSHHDGRLAGIISSAAEFVLGPSSHEIDLANISEVVVPAVVAAASVAAFHPPMAVELARAKERLLSVKRLLKAEEYLAQAQKGERLAMEIDRLQAAIRQEIHTQTQAIIANISTDIQRMWTILHPGNPIEDVRLHIPRDADKAIDISLKFHGKELDSPRLTLSEGYRNSLGLCVFLAMASRDQNDRPIVLDDVIVSLDRGHRGMVAGLLRKEFASRQVLLFTHDRDWYADLRQQLDAKEWKFQALSPFRNPGEGIRWSHRDGTFDDARRYLKTDPDVAANEARKVMDLELSIHTERLALPLAYARGERNDKRGGHEFLQALISSGRRAFRRKLSGQKETSTNEQGIQMLRDADVLLLTWANRGSHTDDVVESEAEELIAACERAIEALKCLTCNRYVHYMQSPSDGTFQCECGTLKWK